MFSGAFENYYFNGNYGLLSVQYKLSSIPNIWIKILITTKMYLHFFNLKCPKGEAVRHLQWKWMGSKKILGMKQIH